MTESIKVCVRFRPPNARELVERPSAELWAFETDGKTIDLSGKLAPPEFRSALYDRVFNCDAPQEEVYSEVADPIIRVRTYVIGEFEP
jgi:hypothetical protein